MEVVVKNISGGEEDGGKNEIYKEFDIKKNFN